MGKSQNSDSTNVAARNRKARHNYYIESTLEAGLVLLGTEVKSLRKGRSSIEESYAAEEKGELFLLNSFIPSYTPNAKEHHEPRRRRKILLHKSQINRLAKNVNRDGMTLIPLSLYFNSRGMAKVEIGIAKGKRKYEKRASLKEKDWKRTQNRLLKGKV